MFHISEVDKGDLELGYLISELGAFQSELYPADPLSVFMCKER
jgi:putative acetyltransferase